MTQVTPDERADELRRRRQQWKERCGGTAGLLKNCGRTEPKAVPPAPVAPAARNLAPEGSPFPVVNPSPEVARANILAKFAHPDFAELLVGSGPDGTQHKGIYLGLQPPDGEGKQKPAFLGLTKSSSDEPPEPPPPVVLAPGVYAWTDILFLSEPRIAITLTEDLQRMAFLGEQTPGGYVWRKVGTEDKIEFTSAVGSLGKGSQTIDGIWRQWGTQVMAAGY